MMLEAIDLSYQHDSEWLVKHLVQVDDGHDCLIGYQLVMSASSCNNPWSLGTGRLPGKGVAYPPTESDVDFLLCGPDKDTIGSRMACRSIGEIHGRFSFHLESGVLVYRSLSDKHPTPCEASPGVFVPVKAGSPQPSLVMYKRETLIKIGVFVFRLVYNSPPPDQAAQARSLHARTLEFCHGRASANFSPFPPSGGRLLGRAMIYDTIERHGPFDFAVGVVVDSGELVLVATAAWSLEADEAIRESLQLGAAFGLDLSDYAAGVLATWCSHGSPACILSSGHPRRIRPGHQVHAVWRLYERKWSLEKWPDVSYCTKMGYFRQTLIGLHAVHRRGMMHGRIQPSTLALTFDDVRESGDDAGFVWPGRARPPEPPRMTALFDGVAELHRGTAMLDRPASSNTPFAAPEVWEATEATPYGPKADVFSLAVCWLDTLASLRAHGAWGRMDHRPRHAALGEMLARIRAEVADELFWLLARMVAPDPAARPSAEEALGDAVWDCLFFSRARIAGMVEAAEREREGLDVGS
jgi:hypothetical protein